ncbi:acyloxyacyl hydrolase [Tsuneonella mangrovi]|uniref:acyloxyacyl hydrolase n=1 Tax=Tsuneonella mangrovi TaxID=1982042 RepID=UPI000BA237DB|nr:acyloxyacyl hydrolase [Tsuneonella mangrovi]
MIRTCIAAAAAIFALVPLAAPAHAGEVYGGVYAHAVDTPFTLETGEGGTDLQFGYRFDPVLGPLRIEPYVFGSVNLDGNTDFGGVGVSRKIPVGLIYVRPGVGLVVHDAPGYRVDMATGYRTDLGSRVLFEPEIAVGTRIAPRLTVEASWVHISNARLFNSEQNPGIDTIGLRLNLHL